MCIGVFIWQAHPIYPFLLLLNRDEFHHRWARIKPGTVPAMTRDAAGTISSCSFILCFVVSNTTTLLACLTIKLFVYMFTRLTKPLEWWEQGGGDQILGGRDEVAGGTWLASNKLGKLAFLTNVRELNSLPNLKSRGHLPIRFLESEKDPMMFAEEIVREADLYNGFNLILADINSKNMIYVTNRPKQDANFINQVSPGIHVLTNANLDTPWPKAQRLKQYFTSFLNMHGDDECPILEMSGKIMRDTVKDEKEMLPGIFPPEWEYQLSSIYVDIESPQGHYGTRSTSVVSVKTSGEVTFYESRLENSLWKEKIVSYVIENMK